MSHSISFVRLPKNYSKNNKQTYPVVYLLDGNAYFDQVSNSVDSYLKKKKGSVDLIIIGIGYANAYVMDSLRNRDYTFPEALPSDSFKISGLGDRFYVDSAYRTDKSNRTIAGHSLGGYFVLYALNQNRSESLIFNNFIAASPSIYYHDNYLANEISRSQISRRNTENIKLYLTIGELEVLENQTNDFEILSKMLTDKKFNVQTEVYKGLEHMGTAIPTFESGIQLFLTK